MKHPWTDRPGVAVVALLLLAAGAAVIEWRFDLLGLWSRFDPGGVRAELDANWAVWTAGAAALVLAILAVWWLLAHLPRPVESRVPLGSGGGADRIDIDVRSVAPRLRDELERAAPVDHVTTRRTVASGNQLVQLRAHVDPRADGDSLVNAARQVDQTVASAFPDGEIATRILVNAPRKPSKRRTPRVH